MASESATPAWWDLHVRVARGEQLSSAEQQEYDRAVAEHDRSSLVRPSVEELKQRRALIASLSQENTQLRARLEQLEAEARQIERTLSQETRELLGVTE
jgi:predicted RNase H-like nuclease (RuvC/YqgF family)